MQRNALNDAARHPADGWFAYKLPTLKNLNDAAGRREWQVRWFFYNDKHCKINQKPILGVRRDDDAFGHTKGVMAFGLGTDTECWRLHD